MNLRDLKISTLLILGFGTMALLITLLGATAYLQANRLDQGVDYIMNSRFPVVTEMKELGDEANLQARALRNVALMTRPEDIQKEVESIAASRAAAKKIYEQLETQVVSVKGKELLAQMKVARNRYFEGAEHFMGAINAGKKEEAVGLLFSELRPAQLAYIKVIDEMGDLQIGLMTQAGKAADATAEEVRAAVLGISALALVAAVAMGLWITRTISRPLNRAVAVARAVSQGDLATPVEASGSNETAQLLGALRDMQVSLAKVVAQVRENSESVAMASSQIAQGNQDLSGRTEEQASALEETAASMEQLSSTVKQNAESARQANQLAMGASTVAMKGGEVVSDVVETMKGINDSSRRIAEIIGVIDGIAFQTNILALNAAVEAARAGEQGRGFAVVAGEVRSLAHRSAEAAKEIKTLIGASVDRVEQGTALVDRAGETMTEVVNSIRRVTDIMGEISAASSEQSAGVAQVGEAVSQMDRATQQNAALVEESAAAAESLKMQAQDLVKAVAVFRLGHEPRTASPAPTASASPSVPAKRPVPPLPRKLATPSLPAKASSAAPRPASPAAAPAMMTAAADATEWESF